MSLLGSDYITRNSRRLCWQEEGMRNETISLPGVDQERPPGLVRALKSMVRIEVERWIFWSPESSDPALWLNHWQGPNAGSVQGDPDAGAIPPMQRRRMSRLSKMALATALEAMADNPADYSIFCSRHGEIIRTREILSSISAGTEISPTAFAQSVHNTGSGLFTILACSNAPSMSMASGANTFAYGWLEAQAYLGSNPDHRVLLVDFDEVIPAEYQRYSEHQDCDHAMALVLRRVERGGISMASSASANDGNLPQGPQFLAWLETGEQALSLAADGQGWRWER